MAWEKSAKSSIKTKPRKKMLNEFFTQTECGLSSHCLRYLYNVGGLPRSYTWFCLILFEAGVSEDDGIDSLFFACVSVSAVLGGCLISFDI